MIIGFDWTYLYVNGVAAESAQNKPENLIGRTILEMYPGVEKTTVFAHYKECMEKRTPQRFEESYTFANGETRWYSFSVEPIPEGIFVLSIETTEQKQAEEAAWMGQEEFEQFFENAPLYCYMVSPQATIERMNKAALTALGYSEKEIVGKPLTTIYAPEAIPTVKKLFERWKKEGVLHDEELVVQTKSGKKLNILLNVGAVRSPTGEILHSISIQQDITQKKVGLEKLRENEAELKRAQHLGRIGNWTWNIATDKIIWSDEYYRIIGLDPKQNPPGYAEHLKAYTPESAARLDAAVKREMQTGEPYVLDLEFTHPKESAARWIRARSETITDVNGTVIGLRGTAQDITEQVIAKKELEHVNRALRVVSGINQVLIHANDEIVLLNEACHIAVEVGDHRMAWVGFADNDVGKTVRPVARAGYDAGYVDAIGVTWADTERGRGPTGMAVREKRTVSTRDIATDPVMGPWRTAALEHGYRSSIALPLLHEGNVFGVLTIYSGEPNAFSEQETKILQELADDLAFGVTMLRLHKKVEERTKEVDQLKNKFIQIVSHQLRTPLSVIRWNLEAVLDRERGEVAPAQVETLRGAYAANIEIISRLDDLLVAMDIEEGQVRLEMDTVDIGELLQSVCEEKLQPCQLKKITYEITPRTVPLPSIRGDAVKIRDVVARLVDNAITYSNDGGHISVTFFVKDKKIRFEITDTGVGIPTSEQPHIFERFHRGWNAALMKPDASGLSLFISKNYISAHHGTIGFVSTEKKGSTFWFELPIV